MEDIIYEFRNIVEESRTEDRQDYYIKLRNALDLIQELEEEVESQDKTIDKLVEEQEEREKYTHSLEEENKHRISQVDFLSKEYDIMFDTINNLDFYIDDLIKECKEGIERLDGDDCDTEIRFETEIETLQRIKDKLSNDEWQHKVSIPISVIQNKIDWYKAYEGTVMYKKYNYEEIIQTLQKLLEEGNK
jgi:DNA repair exonuclease SbcCD ATPase subunit